MYGVKKEDSFKFLTNKIKLSKETLNFIESQDKNKIFKISGKKHKDIYQHIQSKVKTQRSKSNFGKNIE